MQTISMIPVLLILEVLGYPADPVTIYKEQLLASTTTSDNQLLLTITKGGSSIHPLPQLPYYL